MRQLHIETSLSKAEHMELCVFSDASTKAIGAVAYFRVTDGDGQIHVGFVMGKAKLALLSEPTTPRLELCGAVLAVEMVELILEEIHLEPDNVKFCCDSRVVRGYIYNEAKHFYVYVHNRTIPQTLLLGQCKLLDWWRKFGSLVRPSFTNQTKSTKECQSPLNCLTPRLTGKYIHSWQALTLRFKQQASPLIASGDSPPGAH